MHVLSIWISFPEEYQPGTLKKEEEKEYQPGTLKKEEEKEYQPGTRVSCPHSLPF